MIKFLYIAVGVYSLMGAYLYLMQRNMMYFPTPENNHRQAEVVWLETNQQRLKIWRINKLNASHYGLSVTSSMTIIEP